MKPLLFLILFIFMTHPRVRAQVNIDAAEALLQRVLPGHHEHFEIESMPQQQEQDGFEIESRQDKIVLRGTNGVSVASALHYYLKHFCQTEVSWNDPHPVLPETLPAVPTKIRENSPYKYRYYLNYVTFNYTMAWWDWERWEQEIDWMALHGINMPLAVLGQNAVWQRVYKQLGFTDEDLKDFFSGPAYTAFNWMGLLDGWGGPMPQSWIDSREELQKKILERTRSLGMTPVLPAFTGHVPPAFRERFPDARLQQVQWTVFPDVDILAPEDPMFVRIGQKFIDELIRTYGTDHFYSADTFIEVVPPSDDPDYLYDMSQTIYRSMAVADPDAVWIMQGWMFYFKEEFWQPQQIQAMLNAVPDDNMIVLDLWTENRPVWHRVEAYYGKPWLWCMVHNFGGNHSLFGKMPTQENFLLGRWIEDARRWGKNRYEKDLYERNARNLLTLWHGKEHTTLQDYANRQWSGMLKGFYKYRWEQFFHYARESMEQQKEMDMQQFEEELRDWEWEWVNGRESYSAVPEGDPVAVSREMHKKYYPRLVEAYSLNHTTE